MFEQWLAERLEQLADYPEIHQPIERFARWHHLKRLRSESSLHKNMNYAVRSAKQEITEIGKFLKWLQEEHHRNLRSLRQTDIDQYMSEGTSTRSHIRNFFQWLKATDHTQDFHVAYRIAKTRPLFTQDERLSLVRKLIEADNVNLSIRIAGLIFLLYGVPIGKISMLTIDDVTVGEQGMTLQLGAIPAPVPELLSPLFWAHYEKPGGQQTTNTQRYWLFPGVRAGRPRSPNSTLLKLRDDLGIPIQGIRNTTLQDLVSELDATSLSQLLGYRPNTIARHAALAGASMATYVASKTSDTMSSSPPE